MLATTRLNTNKKVMHEMIDEDLNGLTTLPLSLPDCQICLRLNSAVLTGVGLQKKDLLIVDKAKPVAHGNVVVIKIDGQLLLRKLEINDGIKILAADGRMPLSWQEGRMQMVGVVVQLVREV